MRGKLSYALPAQAYPREDTSATNSQKGVQLLQVKIHKTMAYSVSKKSLKTKTGRILGKLLCLGLCPIYNSCQHRRLIYALKVRHHCRRKRSILSIATDGSAIRFCNTTFAVILHVNFSAKSRCLFLERRKWRNIIKFSSNNLCRCCLIVLND